MELRGFEPLTFCVPCTPVLSDRVGLGPATAGQRSCCGWGRRVVAGGICGHWLWVWRCVSGYPSRGTPQIAALGAESCFCRLVGGGPVPRDGRCRAGDAGRAGVSRWGSLLDASLARSGYQCVGRGELGDVSVPDVVRREHRRIRHSTRVPTWAAMRALPVFGAGRLIGAGGPGRWREPRRAR